MKKVLFRTLVLALGVTLVASVAFAKRPTTGGLSNYEKTVVKKEAVRSETMSSNGLNASASATTTVLYSANFNSLSCDNEQGWTSVDLTAQLGDFWHVDDYDTLGGAYGPLAGTQSLWCGAHRQDTGPLCGYETLPGYGNGWNQAICTKACIAVSGDSLLDVSWIMSLDSEPGYDALTLEYTNDCTGATGWTELDGGTGTWDGDADIAVAAAYEVIPSGAGTVRVRLHFTSDGAWSDEDNLWSTDGAVHLDNLDAEGLATEDFEGEAVGATEFTSWDACTPAGFGDYMGLFPGATLLNDDECGSNLTCVWASLVGTSEDYGCGGHAEQPAVPKGNGEGQYLTNEIWSPDIDITVGSGSVITLEHDVYLDLPLDNLVFYVWHVRTVDAGGCAGGWVDRNFVYYLSAGSVSWARNIEPVGDLIDLVNGVAMNVALGTWDMCGVWCPNAPNWFGASGACHSHAPLLDNVLVYKVDLAGPQWSIRDLDQFQDTFPGDGTLSGTARADMANDVLPGSSPGILPGDSSRVDVSDPVDGIGTDGTFGGAAVYIYVRVSPTQGSKSGAALSDTPSRFPVLGTVSINSQTWTKIRCDSVISNEVAQSGSYCADLNDNLFTAGDVVHFFYEAVSATSNEAYAFGASLTLTGTSLSQAATNAAEFTVLPTGAGDILYVDGFDSFGGQPFFDLAFQTMGILDEIDRYDVRGPSSSVSNRPASRVTNALTQLVGTYQKILWDCGTLESTLGDGTGNPDKCDDYAMVNSFLNGLEDVGGIYIAGDNVGLALDGYVAATTPSAVDFTSDYLSFALTATSAVEEGYGITPAGVAAGGIFSDDFIIYGGCPLIAGLDVLEPLTPATMEVSYGADAGTNGAVIAQVSTNPNDVEVGVVFSGFSFFRIRDDEEDGVSDRAKHLYDIITWLGNIVDTPTPVGPTAKNSLSQNYPNPFNPQTTIAFSVKDRGAVNLKIYNVSGQLVRTLANEEFAAGAYTKVWDGRNDAGQTVSSGVYFYKLVSNNFTETKKMVLLK